MYEEFMNTRAVYIAYINQCIGMYYIMHQHIINSGVVYIHQTITHSIITFITFTFNHFS